MAKSKKPRQLRARKSVDDIAGRRLMLAKVIEKAQTDDKHLTEKEQLAIMKKKGYNMSRATLYTDKTALNRSNTFVRDLAESNYSKYIEDIFKTLDFVEAEARIQYNKKWTQDKVVKKETQDGVMVETHITEEQAMPKNMFLLTIARAAELKARLLAGDAVHISVALLAQKFAKMTNELEARDANNFK